MVIAFDVNQKRVYDFLLAIDSNLDKLTLSCTVSETQQFMMDVHKTF